jgi:membrane protein required for colicin V production
MFDYLVLLVLGCSVLISLLRGLVKEVLSLLGWVVALVVANLYGETLAQWLPQVIPGQALRMIVAFLALFIAVRLLMALITLAFESVIKASGLTLADRGLGGLFGLARGVVLVLVVVLLCGLTAIPKQPFWREALFSPVFETMARTLLPHLPGNFAEHVKF